ncbi:hypothetical protein Tco_1085887, partial [Tanacetum coccineum]
MNELNELCDQAYENSLIYKEKTKRIHDSKIKNRFFNVGDRVLLFNSRLNILSGKLKTRWTGPFTVTQVFPYGTVELSQTNRLNFKVNGHRLKHYFGGDIPPMVVPDLQTFPMDNPDLTQVAIRPIHHEPLIFVSANVMDRSIGIDNPCLSWTDISQANTVSFESDYGCPELDTYKGIHLWLIGIRALSYRELGCVSDMSNSDELRYTNNTTLVPPRLPDILPQVYHKRHPNLGLLVLPSVLPNPLTIRRTARISIPPIEPNLAERSRISAINLDDFQLDPITPPPSPSSPFTMAAYQGMIAKTDPTQREEALTETGQNSVPVPEIALTDVKPRVRIDTLEDPISELIARFRQVCERTESHARDAQEEAQERRLEALEE